jgi:hypothetical protein
LAHFDRDWTERIDLHLVGHRVIVQHWVVPAQTALLLVLARRCLIPDPKSKEGSFARLSPPPFAASAMRL